MMKNFLLTCLLLIGFSAGALAQENVTVTGVVTDANREPLPGLNVSVADMPGLGTITDGNGQYSIKVPAYHTLVFSYIGFDTQKVLIKEQRIVNVTMKESDGSVLEEVVITATGAQRKVAVTGAITSIDVEELKSNPTTSIADGLAGVVPGIMAMQTSGRPGSVSEFWIRSISTFGANTAALVLVDGFERDLNEVNVEDIESFSVLKDASATAIYGSKGANGVILINTRRGKDGKINISAKTEGFYNMFTKLPEFVDGYTYASMANEAKITRNQEPLYQPEELELFRLGLDPDLYPNVDWMDQILRDWAWSTRSALNMNGGGRTARYFISGSYQSQQGMYKTDQALKDYNTNANFRKWTYRMNIDVDITKTTLLKAGISGSLQKQNDPGVGSDAIWTSLMGYNSIMVPQLYSDGKVPAYGNDGGDRFNPWVQATMTGYRENWRNNVQTNLSLEQKLDFISKGLRFVGRFGYDTNNYNDITRRKNPELWLAKRYRSQEGELIFDRVAEEVKMTQSSASQGDRREFFEWEMHYDRGFGGHRVGGVVKYNQAAKIQTQNIGADLKNGISRRNQGLAGRANYNWKLRYFIDFNFGYTGSENFHKDNRFGFFPAVSGAWNLSGEPFMKKLTWINMLKIRYSYGKTGNDNLGDIRFPYLYTIETMTTDNNPSGGYQFADYNFDRYYGGMRYSTLASPNVSWEVATKQDLGIDFSLFDDKLSGAVDYFKERRDGIYMTRNYLPWSAGLENNPSANVGIVEARGFDGNFTLKQKLGEINLTLRGNMTYGKNEIIERDEENTVYWYKMQKGHRVNQARGLVSLGLFKDYDDIRNSPRQTYGEVMPGDIKYKDVNGDGVINDDDIVSIGATTRPNLTYGFGSSARWKGFNISAHFQGVGKSTYFINGSTVYMFSLGDGWGNVLKDMANSNRWISAEISGDPATEDPNADYPRLTYGANSNNYRQSTYWLRNSSYIRLKTLDIGYTLPKTLVNRAHFNEVRIFFIGTNLLTFSRFKLWDPEMGSSDGKKYPLSKSISLGVAINL
ncbi:SusC/RagA family TonB-linked outer membrane protein [Gaoshiqia sp. Z1-71]|uniref:SusC/RagA family TonB-linked outer membrane protein n=1 Tax=Gaoshiqia hydrogeniformans TaxID=3290090 RepID=UPI003BF829E3